MKCNYFFLMLITFGLVACQNHKQDTLVSVGEHNIHFTIWKGKGTPILFEAGGGNDSSIWSNLADSLHTKLGATIITYDRPGSGRSELNPKLEDQAKGYILNTVKDLENGLQKIGYDKELLFVAHSYGGFSAALFSSRNPESVKGIVLIDANLKCFFTEEIIAKFVAMGTESALENLKSQNLGLYHEALAIENSIELIKSIDYPNHIKIIDILAETQTQLSDSLDIYKWKTCHKEFSRNNKNVVGHIAKGTGHYIFLDNPEFVIDKIGGLWNELE